VISRPLGLGSEQILVAAAVVGQLLLLRALRVTRER
jgi:hypothetical protein